MINVKFDYSKLYNVQIKQEDLKRVKYDKSTLNYLIQVWQFICDEITTTAPLILQWIDSTYPKVRHQFIAYINQTYNTWDDIKRSQHWDDRKLLQKLLFNPSFINNKISFELYNFLFEKCRMKGSNDTSLLYKRLADGVWILVFTYLSDLQAAIVIARTCRLFYQNIFSKSLLKQALYSANLKLTDKQYRNILQVNVDSDWYMFQLVQNYSNFSLSNSQTDAISHQNLKHYGGFKYNVNSTNLVCKKISFIVVPEAETSFILPIEWEHLRNKNSNKLALFIIDNDINHLMAAPYHANIICWRNSHIYTTCFATLGCYSDIEFWIMHNCTMNIHVYTVDPILFGISQTSNKKLYIFDTEGNQFWHVVQQSLGILNVYNYCIVQLFIQTTWRNALRYHDAWWSFLSFLILSKNAQFSQCKVDINIFLFNNDNNFHYDSWNQLKHDFLTWIKNQQQAILNNQLIKSFKFGIKNYYWSEKLKDFITQELIIDIKSLLQDWEESVERVFGRVSSQTVPSNVEKEWKKIVKFIYDKC